MTDEPRRRMLLPSVLDSYVFDAYSAGEHIGTLCTCAHASHVQGDRAMALSCLEDALNRIDYAKCRIQGAVEALRDSEEAP